MSSRRAAKSHRSQPLTLSLYPEVLRSRPSDSLRPSAVFQDQGKLKRQNEAGAEIAHLRQAQYIHYLSNRNVSYKEDHRVAAVAPIGKEHHTKVNHPHFRF